MRLLGRLPSLPAGPASPAEAGVSQTRWLTGRPHAPIFPSLADTTCVAPRHIPPSAKVFVDVEDLLLTLRSRSARYGHVDTLAEAVIEGARSAGAEVEHFQVPSPSPSLLARPLLPTETLPLRVDPLQIQELLSEATRTKMGAAPVRSLPVIKAGQLKSFDGLLFGFPTRYGRAPAQVSAFFDQTGGEWASGSLVGKFGGCFTGSAGQHGGQETTIFTTLRE